MNTTSTWLITGASSGLGYDLAEHVLSRGDEVVLAARTETAKNALAARYPSTALVVQADVADPGQRHTPIAEAHSRFGKIDYLVNNAGIDYLGAIEEQKEEDYRKVFEVNFFAAVALLRLALPSMRARRSGIIVNMSSMDGIAGRTHFSGELLPDYDASSGNFYRAMQNVKTLSDAMFSGDPKRAARVIYEQLTSNPTVHRIILGSDAMSRIGVKMDDLQKDYDASKLIANSTDFASIN